MKPQVKLFCVCMNKKGLDISSNYCMRFIAACMSFSDLAILKVNTINKTLKNKMKHKVSPTYFKVYRAEYTALNSVCLTTCPYTHASYAQNQLCSGSWPPSQCSVLLCDCAVNL